MPFVISQRRDFFSFLFFFFCTYQANAFVTVSQSPLVWSSMEMSNFGLTMAKNVDADKEFQKFARQSRSAGSDDRVVELQKPLGLVLADDGQGNVFVQTVAPRGNAARSGMIREGDVVTMCSATFGNEMWSTRGVGLTRVLAAIRVRSGSTVKLALESPGESKRKAAMTAKQVQAANEARMAAQAKKDRLLAELEQDEEKLKKKFFGLF